MRIRILGSLGLLLLYACDVSVPASSATPAQAPRETIVSLTFDDGDLDNYQTAQMLTQRGLRATWYVPTALVGSSGYMTWEQLGILAREGHEIGGHTVHHVGLDSVDPANVKEEVCGSREALLAHGFAATSFAYPFGGYNDAIKATVQDCGYASARSIGAGPEDVPPLDAFALRAYPYVVQDTAFPKLRRYVTEIQDNGGGWLILIFHHVCDGCDFFSVKPDVMQRFAEWLSGEQTGGKVRVETIGEVMLQGHR